jgi:serine/threonine protein kinase
MSRVATEQPRAVWCCSRCGAIYHKDFPRCPADGAEVVMAERDPLLGAVVSNYAIDELLGEGGMGRVYLAHHLNLPNKRYAFKVLLGDHAASIAMRARFTREAERASQLDHPNVVKVVDFGQTQHGLLYIVMDYVDGPSLVTLIDESPMPPVKVVGLVRDICKGLVYAHGAGIIHRDLKPENILVSAGPNGPVPRIVDFGLAVSVDQGDSRLTESGMTMGTPAFAAPEQLAGKPIDHRADLYALGITMFEMLTGGVAPFEGHLMEVVSARTTRDAPRISERAPELDIPRELDDLVARLTRRKPAERYADAREVIAALDAVHFGPQSRLDTEPTIHEPPRRPRGGWFALGLLSALAGSALVWPPLLAPAVDLASARHGEVAPPHEALPGAAAPRRAAIEPTAAGAGAGPSSESAAAVGTGAGATADLVPDVPDGSGDEIEMEVAATQVAAAPATRAKQRKRQRAAASSRPAPVEPARAASTPNVVALVLPAAPAPVVVPPPLPPPPPPPLPLPLPPPLELQARLDAMDVSGSLPPGDVRRAIERRWSAIARCMPGTPEIVVARFTIGEARRARSVRAAGPSAQTNACVAAAFTDVQTEAAPDVGDVEVMVRIAFVVKT